MRHKVPHFTSKTSTPRPSEGRGRGWGGICQQHPKREGGKAIFSGFDAAKRCQNRNKFTPPPLRAGAGGRVS